MSLDFSALRSSFQELGQGFRASFVFGSKEVEVRLPSPQEVLGFDLYEEQTKWYGFCFGEESEGQTRLFLGARKYGKTDSLSVYGCVKYLTQNHKQNPTILILTRSQARTKDIVRSIVRGLKLTGLSFEANATEVRLASNKTKQPNVRGLTINSRELRGNHVDVAIMDDPVIPQDETSEVERANTIRIFSELQNIARKIIVLGQPVHKEDLYAVLENSGVATYKSFYNENAIAELALNIEELRKTTPEKYIQSNYYGLLVESDLYPFAGITVGEFEFEGATVACIDPAFGGEDSIGIAIGTQREVAGQTQLLIRCHKLEGNIFDLKEDLVKVLEYFNVHTCYIESNDNGGVLRDFKGSTNKTIFRGFKEYNNKEVRILSRIGPARERILLHSDGDVKEVINWSKHNKHEDTIDAVASLVNFLTGNKDKLKVMY